MDTAMAGPVERPVVCAAAEAPPPNALRVKTLRAEQVEETCFPFLVTCFLSAPVLSTRQRAQARGSDSAAMGGPILLRGSDTRIRVASIRA